MYQYLAQLDGSVDPNVIRRTSDNSFIPNDDRNHDWIEYQAWLAAGNTPLPPDSTP